MRESSDKNTGILPDKVLSLCLSLRTKKPHNSDYPWTCLLRTLSPGGHYPRQRKAWDEDPEVRFNRTHEGSREWLCLSTGKWNECWRADRQGKTRLGTWEAKKVWGRGVRIPSLSRCQSTVRTNFENMLSCTSHQRWQCWRFKLWMIFPQLWKKVKASIPLTPLLREGLLLFLSPYERALQRLRPDVLLTFGLRLHKVADPVPSYKKSSIY